MTPDDYCQNKAAASGSSFYYSFLFLPPERRQAITALLHHPALQDPAPRGSSGRVEPGQSGDPALDTALYPKIGGLRVDLVLPSKDLGITASGVLWPPDADPLAPILTTASRHHPVWVDIAR